MNKKLTFLLALTFLFLFSGSSVVYGEEEEKVFTTGDESINEIINTLGCPLCHTMPGIGGAIGELGPQLTTQSIESSFKNPRYQGKAKNLREYIVESILKPNVYIVFNEEELEPYPEGLMPITFRQQVADKALNKIVDYLLDPSMYNKGLFKRIQKTAKTGDTRAQLTLANLYYYGQGTVQNHEKAFNLYSALVKKGLVAAQFNLAGLYDKGEGTTKNQKKAFSLYSTFVKTENEDPYDKELALRRIAEMHAKGEGTIQNYEKAIATYTRLNNLGTQEYQTESYHYEIAMIYKNKNKLKLALNYLFFCGLATYKNPIIKDRTNFYNLPNYDCEKELKELKKVGRIAFDEKDYKTAFEIYSAFGEQGDAQGQWRTGLMYDLGYYVKKDLIEAMDWYRRASENKDILFVRLAFRNMFLLYEANKNYKKAYQAINLAIEKGFKDEDGYLKRIAKKLKEECPNVSDAIKRLTCYDNLPMNLKNQKCSSETDSLKKLHCYEQVSGSSKCSGEEDTLKRLTCYDKLPDNIKNKNCSSISDSLKRLSCFDNK